MMQRVERGPRRSSTIFFFFCFRATAGKVKVFWLLWEVVYRYLRPPPLEVRDCRHVSQACIPLTEKERKGGRKAWVWGGEGHVVNACRVSHTEGPPSEWKDRGGGAHKIGEEGVFGAFRSCFCINGTDMR
jgi:hypothetical protein